MAKERMYFRVEICSPDKNENFTLYYSCFNRIQLHDFINEKLEEIVFEWAKNNFWDHDKNYSEDYADEFILFEAILPMWRQRIYEIDPNEFYKADFATLRL